MKVLIGCECSGRTRRAMRGRGFDAYSCDLKPAEDNSQWHIQGDVFEAIESQTWDLIILHPECTAMALSGNKHYAAKGGKHHLRLEALGWTSKLWEAAVATTAAVAMENPASVLFKHLKTEYGCDVQYFHPYHFGHPEFKTTGFALHKLPKLQYRNELVPPEKGTAEYTKWERVFRMPPSPERATERSRTYLGIADAIAEQWGEHVRATIPDCGSWEEQSKFFV